MSKKGPFQDRENRMATIPDGQPEGRVIFTQKEASNPFSVIISQFSTSPGIHVFFAAIAATP
jgi:hypothetical protein